MNEEKMVFENFRGFRASHCSQGYYMLVLSRRDIMRIAQRFNVGEARPVLPKSRRDG